MESYYFINFHTCCVCMYAHMSACVHVCVLKHIKRVKEDLLYKGAILLTETKDCQMESPVSNAEHLPRNCWLGVPEVPSNNASY